MEILIYNCELGEEWLQNTKCKTLVFINTPRREACLSHGPFHILKKET